MRQYRYHKLFSHTMSEKITLAFYRPEGNNEHWINKVAQVISGEFTHVEMVFRDPKTGKNNLAVFIYQGETCGFRPKTYGRTSWSFKSVQVSVEQAKKMRDFAKKQADNNIPFNKFGLIRAATSFPRPTDGTCWFCSELVVATFQEARIFMTAIPSTVSPTDLWNMLSQLNTHSEASPLMNERISKTGLSFSLHQKNQGSGARHAAKPKLLTKKWDKK